MKAIKRTWMWLTRTPSRPLVPALFAAILLVASSYGNTGRRTANGLAIYEPWAAALQLVGAFLLVLAVGAFSERLARRRFARGDRRELIRRLTEALETSLQAVDAIKAEIEEGDRALEELERRMEQSKNLAQLSEEESEAVRAALRRELFGRRSWVRDVLFTVIGGVGTYLLTRFLG